MNLTFYVVTLTFLCGDVLGVYEFSLKNCNIFQPDGITTDPQSTDPPYRITLSDSGYYPGYPMKVKIDSPTNVALQNVMITTTCIACPTYGVFSEDTVQSTTFDCDSRRASGIAASSNVDRYEYIVIWTPSADVSEELNFRATIVHNETTWWSDLASSKLKKMAFPPEPAGAPVPEPTVLPQRVPEPELESTQAPKERMPFLQTCSGCSGNSTRVIVFESVFVVYMFMKTS